MISSRKLFLVSRLLSLIYIQPLFPLLVHVSSLFCTCAYKNTCAYDSHLSIYFLHFRDEEENKQSWSRLDKRKVLGHLIQIQGLQQIGPRTPCKRFPLKPRRSSSLILALALAIIEHFLEFCCVLKPNDL